jgi:hypothetical protein
MTPLHAVHFFKDDSALSRIVARFLGDGLLAGQPALAIATPAHRAEILRELTLRGLDVDQLVRDDALLLVDAEATLATFLSGTDVQTAICRARITELVERCATARGGRPPRVYGEMVDLLWRNSLHLTAVRLETVWNQIAASLGFSLLCSYSLGYFNKDASLDAVCRTHTHVVTEDGEMSPMNAVGATIQFA